MPPTEASFMMNKVVVDREDGCHCDGGEGYATKTHSLVASESWQVSILNEQ